MVITPVLLNDHNTTAPDEVVPHKDTSSQTTAIKDKDVKPMYGDEPSVAAIWLRNNWCKYYQHCYKPHINKIQDLEKEKSLRQSHQTIPTKMVT